MAILSPHAQRYTPWFLSAPAIIVFMTMLIAPLILTLILSFHVFDSMQGIKESYTLTNYLEIFSDSYYLDIFLRTAGMALVVTFICVLLGVPETIILSRLQKPWRGIFLMVILAPLLISVVVRTLGWSILMGTNGLINQVLAFLHLTDSPVRLLFTMTGVTIAMVHVMIPFMIISVWASLQKLDGQVENAGRSLGASSMTVMRRIVLPQLLPGILSGSIIVFALSASSFATPALLGGRRLKVVATAAYDEFLSTLNWPLGASIALILLVANIIIITGCNRLIEKRFSSIFEG